MSTERKHVEVQIYRAEDIGQTAIVPELTIVVREPVPEMDSLTDAARLYEEQGREICAALVASLPGGTISALLVELLGHRRSLLRVIDPQAVADLDGPPYQQCTNPTCRQRVPRRSSHCPSCGGSYP